MDPVESYRQAKAAGGLVELEGEGFVRAQGEGMLPFLQRLVANDVGSVPVGKGRRTLLLDVKGKIQADLAFLRTGEQEGAIQVPSSGRATTFKMLTLYGIADPVEFEDLTDEATTFSIQGPISGEAIATLAPGPLALASELDHVRTTLAGIGSVHLVRHDRSGLGGIDVRVPREQAAAGREALLALVTSRGGCLLDGATLETLRLEAWMPRFPVDFGPETIPQEARLEEKGADALSFEKGCFLGQEVVARLRFRGHVNRILCGLSLPAEVPPGTALTKDGKDVGKVSSCARSFARGGAVGFAYVRREHAVPGVEIQAAAAGGPVAVRVEVLAYSPR